MAKDEVILASERFGGPRESKTADRKVGGPSVVAAASVQNPKTLSDELRNAIDSDRSIHPAEREKLKRAAQGMEEAWSKHVSAPGTLGLPKLLEARRLEYGIVDQAFAQEAVYDRIYVWQVPRTGGETFEGTMIIRPEQAKAREEESCPRGIVVSAGLKALDNLRSNGIDLGHVVNFIRSSPWRMPIGVIGGVEIPPLMVMRDGDLISSEDLAAARRAGKVSTIAVEAGGSIEHRLVNEDGTTTMVKMPWMSEDY